MHTAWRERSEGNMALGCSVRCRKTSLVIKAKGDGAEAERGRLPRKSPLEPLISCCQRVFIAEKPFLLQISKSLACPRLMVGS